jgi:hypothetical protein
MNCTHNFLYCEIVTEEISFHDVNTDPDQVMQGGFASLFLISLLPSAAELGARVAGKYSGAVECPTPIAEGLPRAEAMRALWLPKMDGTAVTNWG